MAQMNTSDTLTAEVKFRLKPEQKKALEAIAGSEDVSLGVIARRAMREFIAKNRKKGVRK